MIVLAVTLMLPHVTFCKAATPAVATEAETATETQSAASDSDILFDGGQEYIGNLAVSAQSSHYIENVYTGKGFSGTGDLFASVVSASLVKGLSIRKAMEKATYFLQEAIEEASEQQIPPEHGVYFEKYLSRLL